jgi:hypothetical protein
MTGSLVETSEEFQATNGQPRHLQKPFRISDVVALLQEIFAAAPN